LYVKNGYTDAHQFYVARTLSVFLIQDADNVRGDLRFYKTNSVKKNYYLAKKAAMVSEINSSNA
jgi:hypothetical protein